MRVVFDVSFCMVAMALIAPLAGVNGGIFCVQDKRGFSKCYVGNVIFYMKIEINYLFS